MSHFDCGFIAGHSPVGILSSQTNGSILGMPIGTFGTSINQTINNAIKNKKSSIFKFSNNNLKKKSFLSENMNTSINPFIGLDQSDYTSPNVKQIRKISKMPFKVLDAPSL